ncbi:hypothetical protein HanIR_Chr08g0356181 [Helianthus annuus]|nr:hypothetical protein HanIR_Chr08g0356181 [Helianthus annuus]
MHECATLTQFHARVRHATCEPIRARHTVVPYWLTLVRCACHIRAHAPCAQPRGFMPRVLARGLPRHALRTHTPLQPLGPCSPCDPPRVCGQKYKGGSQAARGDAKCAIKAPHCASSPTPHARMGVRVRAHFPGTLSVCFHETIRMESSHLNTHLVSSLLLCGTRCNFTFCFSIQCFKHPTLSIDISFILAPFWTWFSSLRNSSNIEDKPTNKYIKKPLFLIFIFSPK